MNEDNNKKEDCPLCKVSEDTIKSLENARPTKKERYLLKKEKKEQDRLIKARKKKLGKVIKISVVSLVVVLVVGGTIFGIVRYIGNRNFGDPKIEITNLSHNAGTISMADGLLEHTFEIKNVGEGDLKISEIRTSCMCTTVRLRVGDKLSRGFGMHDNSTLWSEKIAPGETGYLEVTFDPNFHGPEGTGPVTRVVYVSTNDLENKDIEFILTADVVE